MGLVIAPKTTLVPSFSDATASLKAQGINEDELLRQVILSFDHSKFRHELQAIDATYAYLADLEANGWGNELTHSSEAIFELVSNATKEIGDTLKEHQASPTETVLDVKVINGLCFLTTI